MSRKRALITFFIGVMLVEAVVIGGLILLGATSEAIVLAYALLVCGAGLGVGEIFTRYRW
jgi:hypothetical protein